MKNFYTTVFVFFLVIFSYNSLKGQNHLEILDPLRNWQHFDANIDEMTIDVRPYGTYFEVEIYMTFSTPQSSNNNLEIDMDFRLP